MSLLYLPPDMEAFLTGWLRARIPDIRVSNKEPDTLKTPLDRPLVVIRDDSGSRRDLATFERRVGVSVLAGSKRNDKPAADLSGLVYAHLTCQEIAEATGSPVAAVIDRGCNGPYPVAERQDVARRYLTVEYSVVGTITDIQTPTIKEQQS